MNRYDVVVFGASGFTGQYVVEELVRNLVVENDSPVTSWAVAGRSQSKLKHCLDMASKHTGVDVHHHDHIPVIQADVTNRDSLRSMCQQAKILINCVGPYRMYGESVVQACLDTGTHHLDISGEPGFLDGMQLHYDEAARKAGVYILGACGFGAVPNDMGVLFTQDQAKGDLSWVDSYVSISTSPGRGGFHFGTWQSGLHSMSNFLADLKIHKQLLAKESPVPKSPHKKPRRLPIFYSSDVNSWSVVMQTCDESIVRRTQNYRYHIRHETPVRFNTFFRAPNIMAILLALIIGTFCAILAQFRVGLYLLEKYPWLFSFGLCHKVGPSREKVADGSFSIEMVGRMYRSKHANPDEQHTEPPTGTIVTRVSGPELAYITTPICLLQCAYVILSERDRMPHGGGVMTTGMAFGKTTLIERLHKHGVKFEIIKQF